MPGYELWSEQERNQVNEVLQSGVLLRYGFDAKRTGWKCNEFEAAIRETTGCGYAQLTSSGTAALITALAALGIGEGDEVILPVFTFVASFEAIISVGAIPVFADVDETLTLDPLSVRNAINNRTKAVMPVHMCGTTAWLDTLATICREHRLILLEDACQAIGARYKGKHAGTIGDAGVLSFDFMKTVTCGEGGAVLTNREDVFLKCNQFADHGHDHEGEDRGADQHPYTGINYRISELHAAAGLAQIRRLPEFLVIQKKNHAQLRNILSQVPEITFRSIPDPDGDSCSFLSWYLPGEEITRSVISEMKSNGIWKGHLYWYENNWHYIRNWEHLKKGKILPLLQDDHRKEITRHANKDFSASDAILARCISTQISLIWTEEQIDKIGEGIVQLVRKSLSNKVQV